MYCKEIDSSSTYCSQMKALTRASKKLKVQTSLRSGGAAEEGSGESRKPRHPQTHGNQSCVFSFLQSLAFFMMVKCPQKCLGYLGNIPSGNTALQRSHCVVILKIYCLICLELKRSLVAMSKIGSGMLNHPVPCNLCYVFCQVLLKEKKQKDSRHQPALKAMPAITDKDKTGLSDIRPAAGNSYCLRR